MADTTQNNSPLIDTLSDTPDIQIPEESQQTLNVPSQPAPGQQQLAQAAAQAQPLPPSDDVQLPEQDAPDTSAFKDQPKPMVRFQHTVGNTLRGMLMGLAQGGIPGAVAGGVSPTTVQRNADQNAQVQESRVKFASAQAADMAARAALADKQLHSYDEDHQNELTNQALSQMTFMKGLGITPTLVVDNNKGGNQAMVGLQQLTSTHGAVPPMFTLNLGNKVVGYDLTQLTQAPQILDQINQVRAVTGQSALTSQAWAQLPEQTKVSMTNGALGFWNPMPSEDTLTAYKQYRATVGAQVDSPEKKANLARLDSIITPMQKVLDESTARKNNQEVQEIKTKGAAETQVAANRAYAVTAAQMKASNQAARNPDGSWSQTSAPVRLVEGFEDPSQLSKRSKDYNATLDAADAYSMQKYGVHFDVAQAQNDYRYASNTQTQNTLKMINGMSEPGGAIEIASNAAKNLPQFNNQTVNKVFSAAATEFGSTQATNFHTAMLGLADEYSKVMGGGVSSDTGRQQSLDILKAAYSKGQLSGAVATMQQDIAARKKALIGNNRYLARQYGQGQDQQPQFQKFSSDGKWGWNGQQWVSTGR